MTTRHPLTPRQRVALFVLAALAWLLSCEAAAVPPCSGSPSPGQSCVDRQGQEWTGTRQGVPVISGR